jgi:ATP-dependent DNA ligase
VAENGHTVKPRESRVVYYAFDILIHKQRNLTDLPLSERRAILSRVVEPGEHVALFGELDLNACRNRALLTKY